MTYTCNMTYTCKYVQEHVYILYVRASGSHIYILQILYIDLTCVYLTYISDVYILHIYLQSTCTYTYRSYMYICHTYISCIYLLYVRASGLPIYILDIVHIDLTCMYLTHISYISYI